MRVKKFKINKNIVEGILLAGSKDFKIYSSIGIDGVILVIENTTHVINKNSLDYKKIMDYVNMKYQPIESKDFVLMSFKNLLIARKEKRLTRGLVC